MWEYGKLSDSTLGPTIFRWSTYSREFSSESEAFRVLGEDGWEMVSHSETSSSNFPYTTTTYTFKRSVEQAAAAKQRQQQQERQEKEWQRQQKEKWDKEQERLARERAEVESKIQCPMCNKFGAFYSTESTGCLTGLLRLREEMQLYTCKSCKHMWTSEDEQLHKVYQPIVKWQLRQSERRRTLFGWPSIHADIRTLVVSMLATTLSLILLLVPFPYHSVVERILPSDTLGFVFMTIVLVLPLGAYSMYDAGGGGLRIFVALIESLIGIALVFQLFFALANIM